MHPIHPGNDEADALAEAIEAAGGPSALARRLGVSRQAVNKWRRIPPGRVLDVERVTEGRVTRHRLRPDLYPLPGAA